MAAAMHDMNELKRRMQGALQVLKQELGGLRTGRASATLLADADLLTALLGVGNDPRLGD